MTWAVEAGQNVRGMLLRTRLQQQPGILDVLRQTLRLRTQHVTIAVPCTIAPQSLQSAASAPTPVVCSISCCFWRLSDLPDNHPEGWRHFLLACCRTGCVMVSASHGVCLSHPSHTCLTPVSRLSHTCLTPVSHLSHTCLTPVSRLSHTCRGVCLSHLISLLYLCISQTCCPQSIKCCRTGCAMALGAMCGRVVHPTR
jgi:hypothetical protein